MYRALLLAFALWLIGCAAGTDPGPPSPQPTPTPPSKSMAGAAALAADPPGWPTRSDYELVVLPFYDDSPDFVGDALADFDHCAAVYVATE